MKLLLRNSICVCLVSMTVLHSCILPRIYSPNTSATPLFEDKKDVYIDLNTNCFSKFDFYLGRAFTPNFGAYMGLNASIGDTDPLWIFSGPNYASKTAASMIGLGYFRNINQSKFNRMECFAEYSRSCFEIFKSSLYYDYLGRKDYKFLRLDGQYNKFDLNFNASKKIGNTHNGLNLRVGVVNYFDYMGDDDRIDEIESRLNSQKIYPVVDLGYNLLVGGRGIKFKMQVYLSYGHLPVSFDKSVGVNCSQTFGIVYLPRYRGK